MYIYCGLSTRLLSISLIIHRNTGMFMTTSKEARITRVIFFPDTEKERSDEREK